jgi:hypothetical protein
VDGLLADPCGFFGMSYTEMHAVSRDRLDELQRGALSARFVEQRERIPMVAKLAARQGITSVDGFADVVPLLFEHTMYKSYPLAFLERQRFDQLTVWMDKLTSVDLSGVDASGCDSIDAWLDLLAAETQLDPSYSSGTSGTMSFFPWSRRDLRLKFMSRRVSELQSFGEPPDRAALEDPVHYIGSTNRHRHDYLGDVMSQGRTGYSHLRNPGGHSADLLWLAARLRLAAARGDVSRVEVPERLLARRAELEQAQEEERVRGDAWVETIVGLQGQRVLWSVFAHVLHELAVPRLERGERWSFAPGSSVTLAGGTKGHVLPDDWRGTVTRFVDVPIRQAYGMTELSCFFLQCERGRFHLQPWVIPFVLDPASSEVLPRGGVQGGRAAFFDLLPESHWGGLMTGDEIEIDFDTPCGCGATSQHAGPEIARLSDKRGGDDKITCAASPEAHAEAMQFLVGY